jgi:hypothetical protein
LGESCGEIKFSNLPTIWAIEISRLVQLLADLSKPVRRKIASINNSLTTTKKSPKITGALAVLTHMSPGVMWLEMIAFSCSLNFASNYPPNLGLRE